MEWKGGRNVSKKEQVVKQVLMPFAWNVCRPYHSCAIQRVEEAAMGCHGIFLSGN